jgi:hypothetical protein
MYKSGGYYYLYGSCADNTTRTDNIFMGSLELSVPIDTTVIHYDFFYSNWLGKGNGLEHCFNTTSRGARYNRMRFEFEVPAGYTKNGPIEGLNSVRNGNQNGGTISFAQAADEGNRIAGYQLKNLDNATKFISFIGPYNGGNISLEYTDDALGIAGQASVRLQVVSTGEEGDVQTADIAFRKWD